MVKTYTLQNKHTHILSVKLSQWYMPMHNMVQNLIKNIMMYNDWCTIIGEYDLTLFLYIQSIGGK